MNIFNIYTKYTNIYKNKRIIYKTTNYNKNITIIHKNTHNIAIVMGAANFAPWRVHGYLKSIPRNAGSPRPTNLLRAQPTGASERRHGLP